MSIGLPVPGVILRNERDWHIVDIGQMTKPAQAKHSARRHRDVGRRIIQPEIRFEIVALGSSHHVPA